MHMNGKMGKIALLLILVGACFVAHAGAAISHVPTGGTVYIGEQGLDISIPVPVANTQIAWWAPGASIITNAPDYQITVTDPLNFYVSPNEFGSRTGSWYVMPAKTPAFTVKDPQIGIRIEDVTVNVDITENKWVYRGDEVRFRIDSNLGDIAGRVGAIEPTVTIKVQGPDGGIYSALINKTGATNSLDIQVSTTPYYTVPFWDTANTAYAPGTYTIWAECNANRMKDNYNVVSKTVAAESSLLVQEQNPLISVKIPTTPPTTPATIPTTQKPTAVMTTKVPTTVSISNTSSLSPTISQETGKQPETLTPSPTPTKAAGFCGICAILSGIIGCAVYCARRR